MKRQALLFISLLLLAPCLWAQDAAKRATSLEGALENATDTERDENWCAAHPQECQNKYEWEHEYQWKLWEQKQRQGYCDRFPERCETKDEEKFQEKQREAYCKRFPWKCE